MIDLAEFAFFVAILQTLLRQKGSVPEVGNISGDPEFFSWSGRRKAVVSSFPTQTARTGLRQILRNIKLRRSACSHYISASAHLYQDNRKQNRIHLPLSLCLSLSLSVCLSLSLSLSVCLSVCLSLSLSLSLSLCLSRSLAGTLLFSHSIFVYLSVSLSVSRSFARTLLFVHVIVNFSIYWYRCYFVGIHLSLFTGFMWLCRFIKCCNIFCPLIFCRLEKFFKTQ